MPSVNQRRNKALSEAASKAVRFFYADAREECRCYTCDRVQHWKETHCGHWLSRGAKSTGWLLDNLRCQCQQCNRWGTSLPGGGRTPPGSPEIFEEKLKAEGVDTENLKRMHRLPNTMTADQREELLHEYICIAHKYAIVMQNAILRPVPLDFTWTSNVNYFLKRVVEE